MTSLKPKLVGLYFQLKPGIERNLEESDVRRTVDSFEAHYRETDGRVPREKGIMAFHRMFMITGLALNKALQDRVQDQEERIEIVHDILWKGSLSKIISLLAFFIRGSRDPFSRFLQTLGPNNEWFFPCPPWEKEPVEIPNGVGWHQHKCPIKDFFESEGVVELTRAYGDMDLRIAGFLPDHVELKREKALCYGDGYCDFMYFRRRPVH